MIIRNAAKNIVNGNNTQYQEAGTSTNTFYYLSISLNVHTPTSWCQTNLKLEENTNNSGTVAGYTAYLNKHISSYQPRRSMRKDTDLISQATKDSSGKITFEYRDNSQQLQRKPPINWLNSNFLKVDLYDVRLGKRQWPTVSKSDLVSAYDFEPNEKENLDEE